MLAGVIVIVAGVAVSVVAFLGRAGRLPRNHLVGIRMPSTMKSDAAWLAAHRASWAYSLVAGAMTIALGVRLAIGPEDDSLALISVGVIFVPLLAGAVVARRAARGAEKS
jgi:uncharacterized membrane protein